MRAPARRPARSARAPVAVGAGRAARPPRPVRRAPRPRPRSRRCGLRVRPSAGSPTSSRRWAATSGRAPARSTSCATRSRRSTRPGSPTPVRTTGSCTKRSCSPTPRPIGEALSTAYAELEGAGEDALGAAVAALDGRAPFDALSDRLRAVASRAAGSRARRADDRRVDRRRSATPAGGADAPRPARRVEAQVRPDARRRRRLRERDPGPARRAGTARRARGPARRGRCEARAEAERAARALSKARRAAAPRLADAVTRHLRELALPAATFSIDIESTADPEAVGDDGADDVTFLLAPNPGEPSPTSGQGRVGRRAVAHDARAARRAVGSAADTRVRRGRRRASAARQAPRSGARSRPWVAITRCCA